MVLEVCFSVKSFLTFLWFLDQYRRVLLHPRWGQDRTSVRARRSLSWLPNVKESEAIMELFKHQNACQTHDEEQAFASVSSASCAHIRVPAFDSFLSWFLIPVSDKCRPWEAATLDQTVGFLTCYGRLAFFFVLTSGLDPAPAVVGIWKKAHY